MDALIRQGKVLYSGHVEWPAPAISEAHRLRARTTSRAGHGAAAVQPAPPRAGRKGVRAAVCRNGMGTTIWSPLASGLLTGKYSDGVPEHRAGTAGP